MLAKFFLKYEGGGGGSNDPPPRKNTLNKPSLNRVNCRGLICGIWKSFWKFGKYSKRLPMTFEKVYLSWIVSWEFWVISEESSIQWRLCLKVAAQEFFSCVLRTMRHFTFAYIATPKILRIILSTLFVSPETALLALISWKLWDFRKLLAK